MKYVFGYYDEAGVECPKLEYFMGELMALCERNGIGFELDSCGDGAGYLVAVPFNRADFTIFTEHLHEYISGVPWLDEAKEQYYALYNEQLKERNHREAIEREQRDRATYELLKRRYEKP